MGAMVEVSIVIVCMNNVSTLYPCIDSIYKYNKCAFEIVVVAYLFSQNKLEELRKRYPKVIWIESNEIRGFAENNNLGLKHVSGKYCLILNDDTEMRDAVVDNLIKTLESLPASVAVLSPAFYNEDGSPQSNGRRRYPFFSYFLNYYKLSFLYTFIKSKCENQDGIYKTYNLSGACFLIKYSVFKSLGFFDERFFFCPEDIALSTVLNRNGFDCYVNSKIKILHKGGRSSSSFMQTAVAPAKEKGERLFYCEKNILKNIFFVFQSLNVHFLYAAYWWVRYLFVKKTSYKIKYLCHIHIFETIASSQTPKMVFLKYYSKIKSDNLNLNK